MRQATASPLALRVGIMLTTLLFGALLFAAPVFAQAIRAKIEALLPQGFARWVAAAVQWRPAVKSSGLSATRNI